jgi:transposase-like protein
VRGGLHHKNKTLFLVVGIRDDSYRKIIGTRFAYSEDSLFFEDTIEDLKEKGV